MYIVELSLGYEAEQTGRYSGVNDEYFFFYAYDYGSKKVTKANGTSLYQLEDDYGIIVEGEKSYKNFSDGDYVGVQFHMCGGDSMYRVIDLSEAHLLDDAEILGDDKRP